MGVFYVFMTLTNVPLTLRDGNVYQDIASKLAGLGFHYTIKQEKIKNSKTIKQAQSQKQLRQKNLPLVRLHGETTSGCELGRELCCLCVRSAITRLRYTCAATPVPSWYSVGTAWFPYTCGNVSSEASEVDRPYPVCT